MRRWLRRLARLYPQRWRARYGAEFDALLEEVEPDWREFTDILKGAMRMQMLNGTAWKICGALAVVGAMAAAAISFAVPGRYVSTAVLRATPLAVPENGAPGPPDDLPQIATAVLSRTSLKVVIDRYDLYPGERQRLPLEDIIQRMRTRDLLVQPLAGPAGRYGAAFRISFAYPEREKAQAVVRALVARFIEANVAAGKYRETIAQSLWHESLPPAERGDSLDVLDPASLPQKASYPNRLAFMMCGSGAGLLLGLVVAGARRKPKWTLQIAACAVAGCVLAAAASFLIPDRYTASATLRIEPPLSPQHWYAVAPRISMPDRVAGLAQKVLSRDRLERIIQDPRFDLYRAERARKPMEEVVDKMRRSIGIVPIAPAVFSVSFTYPDRYKAQAAVRGLIASLIEENANQTRQAAANGGPGWAAMAEHKVGENLQVLDPANLPEAPVSPNRLALAGLGLAAGLSFGICLRWLRRDRPPAPQPA